MLAIALKEWAVVCDLLSSGRLAILLRKGGIEERGGPGAFELEHPRFALYPSFEHQKPAMIKPAFHDLMRVQREPEHVTLSTIGEAARIWQVPSREAFDRLDDLHPWTAEQIDMRFNYRPHNPLYLLAVRCYRLANPRTIENRVEYTGCKSWVTLAAEDAVDDAGATAVMDDLAFCDLVDRIDAAFNP